MVKLRIWSSGYKFWILNHRFHRANGPAVIDYREKPTWYWHGYKITEFEHMVLANQEITNG